MKWGLALLPWQSQVIEQVAKGSPPPSILPVSLKCAKVISLHCWGGVKLLGVGGCIYGHDLEADSGRYTLTGLQNRKPSSSFSCAAKNVQPTFCALSPERPTHEIIAVQQT